MRNCMTYALDIENLELQMTDSILSPFEVRNSFEHLAKKYSRKIRKVDSEDSPLTDGEWLILFLGLKVVHRDYEYIPDKWEYHFAKKVNGLWLNRPEYEAKEICFFSDEEKETMVANGYPISYFAVRRAEE